MFCYIVTRAHFVIMLILFKFRGKGFHKSQPYKGREVNGKLQSLSISREKDHFILVYTLRGSKDV